MAQFGKCQPKIKHGYTKNGTTKFIGKYCEQHAKQSRPWQCYGWPSCLWSIKYGKNDSFSTAVNHGQKIEIFQMPSLSFKVANGRNIAKQTAVGNELPGAQKPYGTYKSTTTKNDPRMRLETSNPPNVGNVILHAFFTIELISPNTYVDHLCVYQFCYLRLPLRLNTCLHLDQHNKTPRRLWQPTCKTIEAMEVVEVVILSLADRIR